MEGKEEGKEHGEKDMAVDRAQQPQTARGVTRRFVWLVALAWFLASIGSVVVYDRFLAQKIVVVDLKGFVAKQRDNYLAGKINDEQMRKNLDKLENVVMSMKRNEVGITADVVVGKNARVLELP